MLAVKSGKLIKNYYETGFTVEIKADRTPVTIADKKAEELLRNLIMSEFPDHGILGEEYGPLNPQAEHVWVIDPIDGTKSFVARVPMFGTQIGLLHKGQPVAGCINNPALDLYLYGDNTCAWLNDREVTCRACASLENALLCTSDPVNPAKYRDGAAFERLTSKVRMYRTWGDCYGYMLLCRGDIDIMADPVMNPWDSLPIIPILRGAGATVTDWQGRDPVINTDSMIAASPQIHAAVIKLLNGETN
ncbi:MAG: inositol monophosphatase family protein [Spirochaetaceae bacterium]|nr:MAG: inositol monophosphatase family protein [Spirochaetaceae bacterium]